MPKSTHDHQNEAMTTDRKFRPDDEGIIAQEKQEFQESEKTKKTNESDQESSTFQEKENEK